MTRESVEQGKKIIERIKEIEHVIHDIKPYLHNDIEITVQKYTFHYKDEELKYRLQYDSPLWLAIENGLNDIKYELMTQLDELDSNSKVEVSEPMHKTSFLKKVWNKTKYHFI